MNPEDVCFQTYTSRNFHPFAPQASEICLTDIAHSLSLTCRFRGHCNSFYSVAQHCVEITERYDQWADRWYLDPITLPINQMRLAFLLHDAAEAYLCDLISPIKTMMPDFKKAELRIQQVIADCFKIPIELMNSKLRKQADVVMLWWEMRDLTTKPSLRPAMTEADIDMAMLLPIIRSWKPMEAKARFIYLAVELQEQRQTQ